MTRIVVPAECIWLESTSNRCCRYCLNEVGTAHSEHCAVYFVISETGQFSELTELKRLQDEILREAAENMEKFGKPEALISVSAANPEDAEVAKQADAVVNHYYRHRRISPAQETQLLNFIGWHGSVTIDQVVELDTCYASKIRVAVPNGRFWIQPSGVVEPVIEDVQLDEPEHPESCLCDECVGDPGVDGLSGRTWFMNQHDYNALREDLARDNDYLHRSYSDPFPISQALEHGQTAGLPDGDFRLTEAAHKRREEALSLIMTGSVGYPIPATAEHVPLLTQPTRSVLMTSILPASVEPKSGEYCAICKQHHD